MGYRTTERADSISWSLFGGSPEICHGLEIEHCKLTDGAYLSESKNNQKTYTFFYDSSPSSKSPYEA